jgi:hypothetical protein
MKGIKKQTGAGDVIRVHVGVEHVGEREIQLLEELQVAVHQLADRIDEDRTASAFVRQEIGVSAGLTVEELAEDHWMPRGASTAGDEDGLVSRRSRRTR